MKEKIFEISTKNLKVRPFSNNIYAIIGITWRCNMEIDEFIENIDIKETSLKEAIARYATIKGDAGITLIEVIHVQTAYIDKLRSQLI